MRPRAFEAPHRHCHRGIPGSTRKRTGLGRFHLERKDAWIPFSHTRTFFTTSIPPVLVPPVIFIGLLVALWTWKCFWIVVMQNKLLYLSWLPPFSRSDKISEYEAECRPVRWEEKHIRSLDGTKLTVCEGRIPINDHPPNAAESSKRQKSVVICYFQGNGGSTPLRLPLLSQVLRSIASMSKSKSHAMPMELTSYTVVALSYRGYWTSSGRATQSGIQLDAQAFLNWVSETYSAPDHELQIILWGHSLGSAVATTALTPYLSRQETENAGTGQHPLAPISGLVMEAPTSNIKDMLISLYPQRWLPYRYLWPFSWNSWCNYTALEELANWRDQKHPRSFAGEEPSHSTHRGTRKVPPILILSPEHDEVVPPYVADRIELKGHGLGMDIARKDIQGAMHTEAPLKADGREALVTFLLRVTSSARPGGTSVHLHPDQREHGT
ncbi:uncharacterized protein N7459_004570 [Penicillium hispanicum]|uniref:uncharacterized protein n=1 Tax=Penicillium hispanicum TaxID=1080232 RepID=UPI00253F91E6|nr:uncharacterized protein N7459_004570 [Penicillium hispanicum]KAJ5584770.1 hypothetical protein N7459_004570 [Penicillium hispanicum]